MCWGGGNWVESDVWVWLRLGGDLPTMPLFLFPTLPPFFFFFFSRFNRISLATAQVSALPPGFRDVALAAAGRGR